MGLHLSLIVGYSAALMGLGLILGRRVRSAGEFLIGGRRLGAGLLFATMLASNIGAGSTVGASATAYLHGVVAWWWVGSAALGCALLAWRVGPALRRQAAAANLQTVGEWLEHRYDHRVRAVISVLLWTGGLFILASQLIGLGWILQAVTGVPTWVGCVLGGIVITTYFAAGGLLTAAWVNVVQLAVKLIGFAVAVPLLVHWAGGASAIAAVRAEDAAYWHPRVADVLGYIVLLAPAFVVSPGLLQKVFAARDDEAVRRGVGWNAVGLALFAAVPLVIGIIVRGYAPNLGPGGAALALPIAFMQGLPPLAGALGLAAVFSAEVSAADAVLLMLTTSLTHDLYRRFLVPSATEPQLLRLARLATAGSGTLGILLAVTSQDVVATLSVFYALLGVSLFVPVVAGLYVPRTSAAGALIAIGAGVVVMTAVHVATGGRGIGWWAPAPAGLCAATCLWAASLVVAPRPAAAVVS